MTATKRRVLTNPVLRAVCLKPPRLNERVLVGTYNTYDGTGVTRDATTIRRCGLTSEIVCETGKLIHLYAVRRQKERSPR